MHADTGKHTFQCNPIQNHTVYSPKGNSIYKALTLSNIYKHWGDAISFLSLSLPLVFLSQAFTVDPMPAMLSGRGPAEKVC